MTEPRVHQPRPWLAAVALLAMVALAGGAAWWAWPEGAEPAPDASTALERARAFVTGAASVQYSVQAVWAHPPLDDPAGELVTDRFTGTVVAVYPAQGTSRLDAGPYLRERIFDGDRAYGREGDTEALLVAQPWRTIDLLTDPRSSRRTFFDRPSFLPALLADAANPSIVNDVGGSVDVLVTIAGSDALQFLPDRPFDQGRAVLTVEHDGRPTRLQIEATGPGQFQADLTFERWDEAAQVQAPTDTSARASVDEPEIAQYAEHRLYLPAVFPPDWRILEKGAWRPDESGLDCRSVRYRIGTPPSSTTESTSTTSTTTTTAVPTTTTGPTTTTAPGWPEPPTEMTLIEHAATCANPEPVGGEPLQAGPYTGSVDRGADGTLVGGITVDDVAIRFETDLDRASLERVLASLAPDAAQTAPVASTTTPAATTTTTR